MCDANSLAVNILTECLRMRPNARLQAPLKALSEHLLRSQRRGHSRPTTAAELLAMRGGAAIEFEAPRMQLEFRPTDFDEDYARLQSPEYAKLAREAERLLPRPRWRKFGKPRDK